MTKKIIPLTLFGAVCLGILSDNSAHAAFLFINDTDQDAKVDVFLGRPTEDYAVKIAGNKGQGTIAFPPLPVKSILWSQGGHTLAFCEAKGLTTRDVKTFSLSGTMPNWKCESVPVK